MNHGDPSIGSGSEFSDVSLPAIWSTLETTLAEICLCLTEALPLAESAGVVVFPTEAGSGRSPSLEGAAAIGTAPAGDTLIQAERRLDEGPVLTAGRSGAVVTSGDLAADGRWRRFGQTVVDLQVHSALAVPLRGSTGATVGVLILYSHQRSAFDARALDLAAAVAKIVTNALVVSELLQRTRRESDAIRTTAERSAIINQAVGVLIHAKCSEERARSRLDRMAQRAQQDVATSARAIVDEARTEAHLEFIPVRRA